MCTSTMTDAELPLLAVLRILVVKGVRFVENSNLNISNLKEYETAIKGAKQFYRIG